MKKYIYILSFVFLLISCDKSVEGLNVDEKNPADVPAYTLLTSAERSLSDLLVSTNVNRNNFRLTVQYWTETTYTDESNYDFLTRKVSDNQWAVLYAGTLMDLNKAKQYIEDEEILTSDLEYDTKIAVQKNQLAIIDLLMSYTFQVLTDIYGDIPYTEALQGTDNFLPSYDNDYDIYLALIDTVDTALNNLDEDYESFSTGEVIYSGDIISWKKFANSLKIRLGVNLLASGLNNSLATSTIQDAYDDGAFSSNSDNCKVPYMSNVPNTNPLYTDLVASGRHDFVVTKPFVDKLISLDDPRRNIYTNGNVNGGTVGSTNSYSSKTHVGSIIETPDFSGTLLDYAEVEILLAEASARGVTGIGLAADHYVNSITASMEDWGVDSADIVTYLANPLVAFDSLNWKESIGEQAWLGFYNRGFEGWSAWRRLDYPALTAPANANAAANGQVPVRMAYPVREQTLNPTNYNAASTAIGGDYLYTKVFWDVE